MHWFVISSICFFIVDCFVFVSAVVGKFLWILVSGGLSGVFKGNVVSKHPPEPADLCAGGVEVPRATQHSVSY